MTKFRDTTNGAIRHARRFFIFVVGVTVVLLGIVLFFTPGPAIIVIPIGLAILATEFVWARRILARFKESVDKWTGFNKSKVKSNPPIANDQDSPRPNEEPIRESLPE